MTSSLENDKQLELDFNEGYFLKINNNLSKIYSYTLSTPFNSSMRVCVFDGRDIPKLEYGNLVNISLYDDFKKVFHSNESKVMAYKQYLDKTELTVLAFNMWIYI